MEKIQTLSRRCQARDRHSHLDLLVPTRAALDSPCYFACCRRRVTQIPGRSWSVEQVVGHHHGSAPQADIRVRGRPRGPGLVDGALGDLLSFSRVEVVTVAFEESHPTARGGGWYGGCEGVTVRVGVVFMGTYRANEETDARTCEYLQNKSVCISSSTLRSLPQGFAFFAELANGIFLRGARTLSSRGHLSHLSPTLSLAVIV